MALNEQSSHQRAIDVANQPLCDRKREKIEEKTLTRRMEASLCAEYMRNHDEGWCLKCGGVRHDYDYSLMAFVSSKLAALSGLRSGKRRCAKIGRSQPSGAPLTRWLENG
jgi:hypothetical protein